MHLKSITVKGFKSFPDRTRLEFGPGVSVIVGPNGSGKSNITDAVLWALGEQSPVAVRGQSMQDVIFAGAPGRQASKGAEVELVLEDGEGVLGMGPEVSILRRLDRSGEGEYRLSGARCRLVDVVEVLSDTGLGKEMHSVISQGRVEAIVTSKPRDRRMLIEEAAGLGKHRKRRRRAQLKLVRTQDNLDRALDVEREARSRLRPLKRQAEAAEMHERLERQTLEARWELARDELRSHLAAVAVAEARAGEARTERQRVESELEEVALSRQEAEEALTRRSSQREELSRRLYAVRSALEQITYRSDRLDAAGADLSARVERNQRAREALRSSASQDAGDERAERRIVELQAALAELEHDREAELERQLTELRVQLQEAEAAVHERAEETERHRAERAAAEARLEEARAGVRQADQAVQAARLKAAEVGSRLAAVNQFLRAHSGNLRGAPALSDELVVDPGYELAVAAALDGRLRAAIVADLGSATELLDAAGADGGRTLIAGRGSTEPGSHAAPPAPGATPLIDHVRGPEAALELARVLLGRVWVVDALSDVPGGFAGVAVTPSGRVFSAATGEVRQAPALGEERILAERNRREELLRATEAAASDEAAAVAARDRLTEELAALEGAMQEASAAHRTAVRAGDEAAEERQRIEAMIERRRQAPDDGPALAMRRQVTTELAAEQERLERTRRDRAHRLAQIQTVERMLAQDRELGPEIQALATTLQGLAAAIAEQRDRFEAALAADREAGEHVSAQLRECARREAELQAELHRRHETLTEAEVELQRSRDRAADSQVELGQVAERLELEADPADEPLAGSERDALLGRLERLNRRREQLGPVNPLAQQEYADAVEHVEELERQRADLETALRELQQLITDTDRQIRELFEQTFAAAARNFQEVCGQLFPGGRGRLRLISETDSPARVLGGEPAPEDAEENGAAVGDEEPEPGVEIEINPAGKEMRRLSLLSGGEKAMTALAFLFAVFLASPCPFYILDEVEAALDDLNIDRFLGLVRAYARRAQFIVVTHQRRTMEAADFLYGVSMGGDGISKVISRRLPAEQAAA